MAHDRAAAAHLVAKLRRLAAEGLDSEERVFLGVCLAPVVLAATRGTEVEGVTLTPIGDEALVAFLRSELARSNLRVVEFHPL